MSRTTISVGPFRVGELGQPRAAPVDPRDARGSRSRVDPLLFDEAGDRLGDQVAQRPARRRRARAPPRRRRRTAASPASSPGPRRRGCAAPRATSASETPARRATASRASSTTRSGSRQLSRPDGGVRPHHEHQLRVASFVVQAAPRSHTCRTAPRARPPGSRPRSASRRPRRAGSSPAAARGPGRRRSACAGPRRSAPGPPRSRSSCQSASWASARWPRCGGLKAEPRTPMPAPAARYSRTWPSPRTTYL